ncbi:hypothetical protein O181_036479 [Austropuccinia psidii MF-1]|uniref:Uncharacterized protein n=1 Tax=Austropuccinia psidii MF-1 TaxID=1389203 RepID=A0A9Q3HBL1_9BASI|nr:hypothetical protein [Austropuccinia psidii MF-1]
MPCKQAPQQGGTQWLQELLHGKEKALPLPILTFKVSELTFPPFVDPSQHNEPPIPGSSQAQDSQVLSNDNNFTCEPEPEVAPVQRMEENFDFSATPRSFIIINDMPARFPLPLLFPQPTFPSVPSPEVPPITSENPITSSPPVQGTPQSHNEALQEFSSLQPKLMMP